MTAVAQLEAERDRVLAEMRTIRSLYRGTLNEQYLPVMRGGKKTEALRGPYYVLSRREGGRTVSRRLRSVQELQQARQDIGQYVRFVELCKAFEQVTEQLGKLARQTAELEQEKKRRKSPSRRTRK